MQSKNFLLLYDLVVRDKRLIEDIASRLSQLGYTVEVARLVDEKKVHSLTNFDVVVINKPHFFDPYRLYKKLKGVKYVVLDTEGVLPGENFQHCLIEPDVYLHWFSHQAKRYNFKKTKQFIVGYPRAYQLKHLTHSNKKLITVATNFSIMGYSDKEVDSRARVRKLKLKNDWSLHEYKLFQEESYETILKLIEFNPDYRFVIKPHPNDPTSLWESFNDKNLANVEIFDHNKDIFELLKLSPNFHFCLDGCTTILDAYMCNIRSISLGSFKELSKSLLKYLEYSNISDKNLNIESIKKHKIPNSQDADVFIRELKLSSLDLIIEGILYAINNPKILKLHHAPTLMHFRHFIRLFFNNFSNKIQKNSSRKKMNTTD